MDPSFFGISFGSGDSKQNHPCKNLSGSNSLNFSASTHTGTGFSNPSSPGYYNGNNNLQDTRNNQQMPNYTGNPYPNPGCPYPNPGYPSPNPGCPSYSPHPPPYGSAPNQPSYNYHGNQPVCPPYGYSQPQSYQPPFEPFQVEDLLPDQTLTVFSKRNGEYKTTLKCLIGNNKTLLLWGVPKWHVCKKEKEIKSFDWNKNDFAREKMSFVFVVPESTKLISSWAKDSSFKGGLFMVSDDFIFISDPEYRLSELLGGVKKDRSDIRQYATVIDSNMKIIFSSQHSDTLERESEGFLKMAKN